MKNMPIMLIGIVLAIIGVVGLSWGRISYFSHDTVVDAGPVKVVAGHEHEIPVSPIVGAVALAGGVGMIVMATRRP